MGTYRRIPLPKATGKDLSGQMVKESTGLPIDLRLTGTTMVLTCGHDDTEPVFTKTLDDGITVADDEPGNLYVVDITPDDTQGVARGSLLPFELMLTEPGLEPDRPVWGHFVVT